MQEVKKGELPVLAVDLGGTRIRTALVSNKGRIMAKENHLTLAEEGSQAVIGRIVSAIEHLLGLSNIGSSQLHSICVAAAGAIDTDRGVITLSPNLPGWRDIPLKDIVQERCQVDTFLINDANAAALGEHRFGVGKGTNNLVYITMGTGIGGGIIIDGNLYSGTCGSAGEIGHMTIDVNGPKCNCGNTGCLEALVSGTALSREAIRRIRQGERSSLAEIVKGRIEDITAEAVEEAARSGDSLASDVIFKAATYLGIGMVNLVNIFNPDMIVVGGGMANMGDLLLEPARQVVKERAFQISAQAVRILPSQLGDDAGLIGAAVFARQKKSPEC
ncbi:ROK family protein [Chloroflexota bacterium]